MPAFDLPSAYSVFGESFVRESKFEARNVFKENKIYDYAFCCLRVNIEQLDCCLYHVYIYNAHPACYGETDSVRVNTTCTL